MRRKSSRNTSSSKTTEKVTEPSTRKSRRHSKRRKRSSSRSSSEDSNTEVDKTTPTTRKDNEVTTSEDKPKNEENLTEEEPVWTVKSSKVSAPTGEIQKLKICLTKPTPSPEKERTSSSRRRRYKSGSHADEDTASPDEKTPRKLRHRGSADEEQQQEEQCEDVDDKKGKGKSKTKHRSKREKSPQIQEVEEQTQSDISENAQVTPQSPQAAIDIRVDNENVSATENEIVGNDENNSVLQSVNASNESTDENADKEIPDTIAETGDDKTSQSEHDDSSNSKVPNDSQMDFRGFEISEQSNPEPEDQEESVAKKQGDIQKKENQTQEKSSSISDKHEEIERPEDDNLAKEDTEIKTIGETEGEVADKEDSEIQQQEEYKQESETKTEMETEQTSESSHKDEPSNKDEHRESSLCRESKTESSTSDEMEHTEETSETAENLNKTDSSIKSTPMEESQRSDEDSRSADVIDIDTSSTPNKDDTSFNLTHSFSPDVQEMVEEHKELKSLKDDVCNLFDTPPKMQRKRKWGNTLAGLELVKQYLSIIDIETIRQFCPDLQFLEESELRMDIRDARDRRRSLSDPKEKRIDRKVSIDYKSGGDADEKRLETQSSVNSSEMEEASEQEVDNSNIIAMNRKISIVDDTASKLKPPPSPAKNPISEVLYITNLVRPFTLKQLKELLERTGKIRENGFWTDRIKSKCYVYYETTDEAEATRNALHGVNWPIGNGKKLVIDYATSDDLEKARNPAPPTPPPTIPEPKLPEKENQVPIKRHKPEEIEKAVKERERHRSETHVREWDIGKEDLHRLRSRSRERNDRSDRRKHTSRRTPSPDDDFISRKQRKKEEDIPQKLMDDLFRKTKTTPSIYWLPLTPEEIATKQQQRLLRMAEHKRRMEESSRGGRVEYGRGAPYRRRYD